MAHVLLNCIKPLLLSKRCQEQSGFTPGRSTVDRILTEHPCTNKKGVPQTALRSLCRPEDCVWFSGPPGTLATSPGTGPPKESGVHDRIALHIHGELRQGRCDSFQVRSGVRARMRARTRLFDVEMDWVLERSTSMAMHGGGRKLQWPRLRRWCCPPHGAHRAATISPGSICCRGCTHRAGSELEEDENPVSQRFSTTDWWPWHWRRTSWGRPSPALPT